MTEQFTRLRRLGIYAHLQTLPSGFKVTLSKADCEPCWGVGETAELALEGALLEWERGEKR
jgi:hypothetical protein